MFDDTLSEDVPEYRQIRRGAFLAVVVSTVAAVGCVISLPLMYNYVQRLHSHAEIELDFCKARTRDMWVEVITIKQSSWHSPGAVEAARRRRQWLFGQWQNLAAGWAFGEYVAPATTAAPGTAAPPAGAPTANGGVSTGQASIAEALATAAPALPPAPPAGTSQPSCPCGTGAAGPPGPPGEPGKDGKDGEAGKAGPAGKPSTCPPPPAEPVSAPWFPHRAF